MTHRSFSSRRYVRVAGLVLAMMPVIFSMAKSMPGIGDWLAQARTSTPKVDDQFDKDRARMLEISGLLQRLGGVEGQSETSGNKLRAEYDRLKFEYDTLAARVGDLPADGKGSEAGTASLHAVAAPPGCAVTTFPTVTNSTPVAIPTTAPPNVVTSTITIAGAQTFLYDVNVVTNITHTNCADLDITLTSPAGTIVTLTTDNGGTNDNVFAGTTWDDNADPDGIPTATFMLNANQAQTHPYANLTVATPLTPEEPLAAFIGENPNGVWTITISDDLNNNGGSLNSWSLNLSTLASAPSTTAVPTASNSTPVPISAVGTSVITSPINVTTPGTSVFKVKVTTNITHTFTDDLQFTITSPAGTIVTLSSGIWVSGAGSDNVYAGTTWDDDANPGGEVPYANNPGLSSDHPYVTGTVVPLLAPVEALGAFIGENPNGTWTLTIADQFDEEGGALNSWSIDITTATCGGGSGSGCTPTIFPTATNSTPVAIPTTAPPNVVTSTITIAGAQTFLYDVNVFTNITHTNNADLDITLTSPAGTIVTLTTDNGGGSDNVFAGTTWDDDADPDGIPTATFILNANQVQTHPYANLTVATPLTPEEPLAAFIGENPNGVWTLRISDDANTNGGSLNSWSLNLSTLASAPTTTAVPTASNSTPVAIPAVGTSVITSPVTVATSGTSIFKVAVTTNISHSFTDDLQFTLTSPTGTIVTLSNGIWVTGSGADNVYAGTTWDDDGNPAGQVPYTTNAGLSSDHPYVTGAAVPLLAPVEGLGAFIGENPNGTWTLTVADQFDGEGGTLNSWSLNITTATCGVPCTLTCPANVTGSNDPNQCGAVVTYAAPTTGGSCGTVTCSPPSGSFFPVGTTTTTCTAAGGPNCTFTVSVADTQPPSITCPANVAVAGSVSGVVVTFPPPTTTDNCPGVTFMCSPPSGSTFTPGTTTVTCTATDAAANTATCSFTVTACTITCPANITVSNNPNQCGAVVNYAAPTTSGGCSTVTCAPASGSFFPVGTTTTTCMVSGGPSCSFTISVADTQPPTVVCPANVTVAGSGTGVIVTFPPPTASDNCPGVTVTCTPPSGSTFMPGTTTVSCAATDAAANTATCSFTVTSFDVCLQDSSNPGRVLLINSATGQYRFCCGGTTYTGTGTVIKKGGTVTLEHNAPDRRVMGKSAGGGKGTGSLQFPPGNTICTISDSTTGDGTCACP